MHLSKKLIVNADGFGFGPGATQGILDAIRRGRFISSVSVNANFPEAERIRDLVKEFPYISVGVHLNPLVGKPCLSPHSVPSLIGPDGGFRENDFSTLLRKGNIACEELEAEFDAQIRKVKTLCGNRLTHIDSQENLHLNYFDLFLKLAKKWGLLRMRTNASLICLESPRPQLSRFSVYLSNPQVWLAHRYRRYQMEKARAAGMRLADNLVTVGYAGTGNKTNRNNWLQLLKNLPPGTHEIYCHPAYPDETLRRWATYCNERAQELEILSGTELRDLAQQVSVKIVSFDAI